MKKMWWTYYAVACAKCGHVFNQYTASKRKDSDQLRRDDEGQEIRQHDVAAHGDDGVWYETVNIKIEVQKPVPEEKAAS